MKRSYAYILIALLLAIVAGTWQSPFLISLATFLSEIFVRLLKLISLPLISLALLATISSMSEHTLSSMGKRVVKYTIFTTLIAATVALGVYSLFDPVSSVPFTTGEPSQIAYFEELLKLVPHNIFEPFLEGNVVSIMLLSLGVGFGITRLPEEKRVPLNQFLQSLFLVIMQLTRWIIRGMPVAIWAFTTLFLTELSKGLPFHELGWYLLAILTANLLQALVILPLFLGWHNLSPRKVFTHMLPAVSFAFFSKSSAAAIPSAIECAEKKLAIDPTVSRFCFPLCTSINMNACAAFILITVLFVAQSNGLSFSLLEKITWIVVATVAAIGNAGVPMGCFFIASALLNAMHLPLALMGMILPFYALLDMLESAINIWSDACVTAVVDKKCKSMALSEDPAIKISLKNTLS